MTAVLASDGYNIEHMLNKSRGAWAYTLFDMAERPKPECINRLAAIEGVIRVRLYHKGGYMNTQNLSSPSAWHCQAVVACTGIDLHKFSVIACDQFSAQPQLAYDRRYVKDNPSTLNMILPEAYLDYDQDERITLVHNTMWHYLSQKVLVDRGESMVFVHRRTTSGIRAGLWYPLTLSAMTTH
jgi:hypothetical protein